MKQVIEQDEALVEVFERDDGRRLVKVTPRGNLFVLKKTWITGYALELIEHVLRVKGPAALCDEIMRDESPLYVQHNFVWDILSYVDRDRFVGQRVLDFGSGSGASSMVFSRMFPENKVVGVELVPAFVDLARHRAEFYGVTDRVSFHLSPDPCGLPPGIGQFDSIILSAVYEHLLPEERQKLLPLLWAHLKTDGILFLNQTPYRWFPLETHTTGLPLINYLPDRLAHQYARRFSRRVQRHDSWQDLLRGGIRGGTVREIQGVLAAAGGKATLLAPSSHPTVKDRIDLWYHLSTNIRWAFAKRIMMWSFKAIKASTGIVLVPVLSLALRKQK